MISTGCLLLRSIVNKILLRGLDDWIQAAEVTSVARTVGGAATAARAGLNALEERLTTALSQSSSSS